MIPAMRRSRRSIPLIETSAWGSHALSTALALSRKGGDTWSIAFSLWHLALVMFYLCRTRTVQRVRVNDENEGAEGIVPAPSSSSFTFLIATCVISHQS